MRLNMMKRVNGGPQKPYYGSLFFFFFVNINVVLTCRNVSNVVFIKCISTETDDLLFFLFVGKH